MPNPFDDTTTEFYVLRNDQGQHSLWPSYVEVPGGWSTVYGPDARHHCLDFVNANWTDIRPRRLRELDAA